jgi:hypothetical protein
LNPQKDTLDYLGTPVTIDVCDMYPPDSANLIFKLRGPAYLGMYCISVGKPLTCIEKGYL